MIEHGVVRSEQDRNTLIGVLKQKRLPFKLAYQDIYPDRSLDQNNYYWFIITLIAYVTGDEYKKVHNDYKKKFLYGYWPDKRGNYSMRVRSTRELNTAEMTEYIEQIRADAFDRLGIRTPNPNEILTDEDELKFDNL
jgi:hypothetical protein